MSAPETASTTRRPSSIPREKWSRGTARSIRSSPMSRDVACGDAHTVFDVPDVGRIGVTICYDMWFPETTRTLACDGAELIRTRALPRRSTATSRLSYCARERRDQPVLLLRPELSPASSVTADRSVFGPGGEVVHVAGTGREIIALELDLDVVTATRERGWQGTRPDAEELPRHAGQFSAFMRPTPIAAAHRQPGTARTPDRAQYKSLRNTLMSTDRRLSSFRNLRCRGAGAPAQALGLALRFPRSHKRQRRRPNSLR